MKEKIAIIGAGLAGLTTIKELTEAGLEVSCFEKSRSIGGVFSKGEASKCYDSVVLTTSNYFTAFSDFMPYGEPLRFWRWSEYCDYLHRYADHFHLKDYINFEHSLTSLRRLPSKKWELTFNAPDSKTFIFDRVAICTGQFQQKNMPKIMGIETFPGPIIHSSEYKNIEDVKDLAGKRVLCFGSGESAANVIYEISSIAKQCVLSLRRPHVHSLRYPGLGKYPIDVVQTRYWHSLPAAIKVRFLKEIWNNLLQNGSDKAISLFASSNLASVDEPGSVVTKTELIFEAQARNGLLIEIGGVREIFQNKVVFESGEQKEFDAIVFCTGFTLAMPFMDETYRLKSMRECYLQMFHPELSDTLAFIGFIRPQQGGIPLIAELQARYYALLCTGQRQLPEKMSELAKEDERMWRSEFYETPNVSGLVNGLRYNEKLAGLIGCKPPAPNLLLSPRKFLQYWFHHVWPSQYRLVGPGARAEAQQKWMQSETAMTALKQVQAVLRILIYRTGSLFLRSDTHPMKWRPISRKRG